MMQANNAPRNFSAPIKRHGPGRWQAGGLTIFTGIFVLILMTLMLLYATRVGVFEQRVSSNEARQKQAFQAAESVVDQGLEYVLANSGRLFTSDAQAMSDGQGGFRAGWFADDGTTPGWQPCGPPLSAVDHTTEANHPCGGDIPATTAAFFYDDPNTASGTDSIPIDTTVFPVNITANATMLMCVLNPGDPGSGCQAPPADEEAIANAFVIVQIMGYGWSDCTDVTDITSCKGAASISMPVANFKALTGPPILPLTTKSTFPPTGSAEIVTNSNAGGIGVPGSVWANNNTTCGPPVAATGVGDWATCEPHEWYGRDTAPEGTSCDSIGVGGDPDCSCTQNEALSWSQGAEPFLNIDIIDDENFPCDLFEQFFGVSRALYETVKSTATIRSDCSNIGPNDSGIFWITGPLCEIEANRTLGSPGNPIILISAASLTNLAGSAEIFGVLYIFDGEDPNATLNASGKNTIYGAVVVDAVMGNYTGTFQIVYDDGVLLKAAAIGDMGSLNSGWRDYGLPKWQ